MESQVRGGTRWKRFAVVMVPSIAATAAVGVALAQGVLAASFSVSGQSFKVTADKLDGTGFSQYGSVDVGPDKETGHAVAVSAFNTAKITNMCQSVVTPNVPLVGTVTLRLTAGDNGTPVRGDNLYIDVQDLNANATFQNINIGVAAGAISKGPKAQLSSPQAAGGFAQEADRAILTDVKQTAWATTAGTFKLSNLKMSLSRGTDKECY